MSDLTPRGVFADILDPQDGGYGFPRDMTSDEACDVELIMVVGRRMKDSSGLVHPFRIPPAVALAIVRALR